jgi:hypothetical protein
MDEPSGSRRIRASDAERERLARLLAAAFADGRLDLTEYDKRVAAAYAAVYRDDLIALIDDLPTPGSPLFDLKPAVPVPPPAFQSGPPARTTARGGVRPYGWPVVVALFAGGLLLARFGWFGPFSVLLLLAGVAAVISWISDDVHRHHRR